MHRLRAYTHAELLRMEERLGDAFVVAMHVSLGDLRKTLNLSALTSAALSGLGDMGTGAVISDADLQSLIASWSREVDDALGPIVMDDYHHGAQGIAASTAGAFGIDAAPTVTSDQTLHHLQQARNRMVNFADSLWEDVRTELSDGVRLGESTEQLASRVQAVGSVAEPRARVVARTEVHTAVETGAHDQMRMFGFNDDDTVKVWESTHDGRTRMTHAEADGQRVALSQAFSVGGGSLMYPGDPGGPADEVINCRCTTVYDVAETAKPVVPEPPAAPVATTTSYARVVSSTGRLQPQVSSETQRKLASEVKAAVKTMSAAEKKTVEQWTSGKGMVRRIQTGNVSTQTRDAFNSAMQKLPKVDGLVYRGVAEGSRGAEYARSLRVGSRVELNEPVSTSIKPAQSASFGTYLYEIETPAASYLSGAGSRFAYEQEAVMAPGQFEVVSIEQGKLGLGKHLTDVMIIRLRDVTAGARTWIPKVGGDAI